MIFTELPTAECEGALLAHSLLLSGRRHAKGEVVTATLLAAALAAGIRHLWVARPAPGDLGEAEAALLLGRALAGDGVRVADPALGRVHLHAARDGLLSFDPAIVHRLNAATDAVAVATLPPQTPVTAGELVASAKIVPYALTPEEVAALELSRVRGIAVAPWVVPGQPLLLQTRLAETPDKLLRKAVEVTAARLARFGAPMLEGPVLPHAVAPLAAALRQADAPLVLVAGATVTSDRRDVIPAAILAAGGEVVRVGMPVDPGNMLVVGRLSGRLVLGLPGCVRSPKRNGLDLVLEHWASGQEISARSIARMGVGGLLEESGHPVPWGWSGG